MRFSPPTGNFQSDSLKGARIAPVLAIAGLIVLAFSHHHAGAQGLPAIPADTATSDTATSDSAAMGTSTPTAIQAPESEAAEVPNPSDGEDGFVVEVDPGQSLNRNKSLPLAMLFSAALPGAGEYYLQEKGHAKAFLL